LDDVAQAVDWTKASKWTFEPVDLDAFPALRIARQALEASEKHTTVLNAANEEAVKAFLFGKISYLDISQVVERTIDVINERMDGPAQFESVDEMEELEKTSRQFANSLIDRV
jgi:1-deoxy-D-xylulose-5-phosphate reductoisomerase